LTKAARKYAAPVALWISLVLLGSMAYSEPLPRAFNRVYPILFQPTNFPIIRFWMDRRLRMHHLLVRRLISIALEAAVERGFADNSAFTFNTTSISNSGFVVDDVATNAVAENSAGAARMTGQRILYVDLSKTLANTNKLLVTPDSVALPANQSVNVAQFGANNVVTGTGAGGVGIPRVTVSNDSSLAANQSVNLAQIAGTNTVNGGLVGTLAIGGTAASNAAITQNPDLIGIEALSTQPAAATTGNQRRLVGTLDGALYVRPNGPILWSCV